MSSDDTLTDKDENEDGSETDIKIETGAYQGQIDSNFIQVAFGVPEEKATMVFMLADELRNESKIFNLAQVRPLNSGIISMNMSAMSLWKLKISIEAILW